MHNVLEVGLFAIVPEWGSDMPDGVSYVIPSFDIFGSIRVVFDGRRENTTQLS